MKLFVTGGTGFIGAAACRTLVQQGHTLLVLTRAPNQWAAGSGQGIRYLSWESEDWPRAVAEAQGVIHLAGESIAARRWTPSQKQAVRASRVETTRRLVEAIGAHATRPGVFISASAIGYYGARGDEELDETDAPGRGFLPDVCQAWEAEAQRAETLGVRVVRLRIGMVLGPGGGALARMVPPFRLGLGGPLGNGRQWVSWIHRDDVVGLMAWALGCSAIAGPVNATAPHPVRMRVLAQELGRALHRPSWAPAPSPVLRLLLGEMAEIVLTGQRVMPRVALRTGYPFRFPELSRALEDCVGTRG